MNKRIKAVMTGFIVVLSLIMVSAPTLAFATWQTGSVWCLRGLFIVYGMVEVM